MPSHIKAALTATTLSIPILDGRLAGNLSVGAPAAGLDPALRSARG